MKFVSLLLCFTAALATLLSRNAQILLGLTLQIIKATLIVALGNPMASRLRKATEGTSQLLLVV
jgi:hypothetical protein